MPGHFHLEKRFSEPFQTLVMMPELQLPYLLDVDKLPDRVQADKPLPVNYLQVWCHHNRLLLTSFLFDLTELAELACS